MRHRALRSHTTLSFPELADAANGLEPFIGLARPSTRDASPSKRRGPRAHPCRRATRYVAGDRVELIRVQSDWVRIDRSVAAKRPERGAQLHLSRLTKPSPPQPTQMRWR